MLRAVATSSIRQPASKTMPSDMAESTRACLTQEVRPRTPHGIKKYRKSYFDEPGARVTHHGIIDDNKALLERIGDLRLGFKSKASDVHVDDLFQLSKTSSIGDMDAIKRNAMAKTIRRNQPLASDDLKPNVLSSDVIKSQRNSVQAKGAIYSAPELSEEEELRGVELYKKSHRSFAPGEQKRRNYSWKLNPEEHRFGIVEQRDLDDNVYSCLQPATVSAKTTFTSLAVSNFKEATSDFLGQAKNRLQAPPNLEELQENPITVPTKSRRKKQVEHPEWNVKDSIYGDYTEAEQEPDADLGKAVRPGWRNHTHPDVTYGCPTVRTDVTPPRIRSISDGQNYGDDLGAARLLYPSRFNYMGIEDDDFIALRSKDELYSLLTTIGQDLSEADFDKLYNRAIVEHGNGQQTSVQGLRTVLNEKLDAEDLGRTPEWW